MNGTLKVTPAKLKSTAASFQNSGKQITTLTNEMTSTVKSLSGQVWSGDAATKYVNKFNGLSDDIQKMIKMVNEHVQDLNDMATAYEKAEQTNITSAETLSSDVII